MATPVAGWHPSPKSAKPNAAVYATEDFLSRVRTPDLPLSCAGLDAGLIEVGASTIASATAATISPRGRARSRATRK